MRNFRDNGHERRWDTSDRYSHPEYAERLGQMALKDAIQNMDEDIERLRAKFKHHGASYAARDRAIEIRDHSSQVNGRTSTLVYLPVCCFAVLRGALNRRVFGPTKSSVLAGGEIYGLFGGIEQ